MNDPTNLDEHTPTHHEQQLLHTHQEDNDHHGTNFRCIPISFGTWRISGVIHSFCLISSICGQNIGCCFA